MQADSQLTMLAHLRTCGDSGLRYAAVMSPDSKLDLSHTPSAPMQLNQITLPAVEVEASVEFYQGLGLRLIVSALPHYARFECPDGSSTFSLHRVEKISIEPSGVVVYFECEDLDAKVHQLQADGYSFTQEPKDEKWLWREARLCDPSGNVICLYFAGENRRHPPWRISS